MTLLEIAQLLGNFGEFLGALAVVATLIYLAVEVRHSRQALDANTESLDENRRLGRAQAYQTRCQMSQDYMMRVADSRHLAPIADRITTDGWDSLTNEEKWRWEMGERANLARVDNIHYQYSQGYLDEEYYEQMMREAAPSVRFWERLSILQGRKQLIDDLMATLAVDDNKASTDSRPSK
jgi:hypothetical protein